MDLMTEVPVVAFVILVILALLGGFFMFGFMVVCFFETCKIVLPHQKINLVVDDNLCFEDVNSLKFGDYKVSFKCFAGDIELRYNKIRIETVSYSWFSRIKNVR